MKCYIVSKPKAPLELITRPIPTPSENQVLLKVLSCGVCLGDSHIINGVFPMVTYPRIPGHEVIGKVVKIGSSIKKIKEGTIVGVRMPAGLTFDGGFAEYMTVPEDQITIIPEGINPVDAAPFLCAGVTTFDALKHSNAVKGDLVGIVGIGGLGHLAIQFASKMGFKVVGISRSDNKKDMSMKLGCEYFINYSKEDVSKELLKLGGAKVILITAPDEKIVNKLIDGLAFEGRLIIVAGMTNKVEIDFHNMLMARKSIYAWSCAYLESIIECIEFAIKENIKPIVEVFKFEDLVAGYERMVKGEARYRVVVKMDD
jgi:propanol-preferring alcohol dehydrogenase